MHRMPRPKPRYTEARKKPLHVKAWAHLIRRELSQGDKHSAKKLHLMVFDRWGSPRLRWAIRSLVNKENFGQNLERFIAGKTRGLTSASKRKKREYYAVQLEKAVADLNEIIHYFGQHTQTLANMGEKDSAEVRHYFNNTFDYTRRFLNLAIRRLREAK